MKRRFVAGAVCLLALGVAGSAPAEGTPSEERIRALERRIEEQQRMLQEQSRAIEDLRRSLKAGAPTAIPDGEEMRETERKSLDERLASVEGKTKHLPDPGGKDIPVQGCFKDGLKLKSADGNFTLDLGGRLQFQTRTFTSKNPGDSTFFNRGARLQAEGSFYKDWGYKVQYDILTVAGGFANSNGAARVREGWVDWHRHPKLALRAGQWKEPYSLEVTTSSRFIDFVERSVASTLAPEYDTGLGISGKPWDPWIAYEIGIFNGNGHNARDNNDDKDVAGRIVLKPFAAADNKWIKGIQLGANVTEGNQEGAFGSISSPNTGTAFLQTAATTQARGGRTRWGGDLVWTVGPFKLQAEYSASEVELRNRVATLASQRSQEIEFDAWYVEALCVLTGEDVQMGRRKPAARFLQDGGWGQWEVAARFGQFRVDDDIFKTTAGGGMGIATKTGGTRSTEGLDEYTIGLNWWPNPNVRWSLNWVRNEFDDRVGFGAGAGSIDSEDAVLMRFQVDF
ncbi:MAG: carbohydrate porin [Planctomycetes bacterium]|nr:carbohydrate porin [Planctomycetota bacterium]